ncbi:MAG TPA: 4-alpha-glucanotransferase, partial [Opitutales bacterium]|nr:4-alpha-glucanotransferase [Opitutales bacterium]
KLPDGRVDFGMLYLVKWPILRLAFRRFVKSRRDSLPGYGSFRKFKEARAGWLEPFSLFMALKAQHGGKPWYEWEESLRRYSSIDASKLPKHVRDEAEAHKFFQYLFFGQWNAVRGWAAEAGVSIIGDMPFYVSRDSADVWGAPENFDLDENLNPKAVAGVPPDYFSADGQLWGNPLYNWEHLAATGYQWWMERLRASFDIFDIVRLDHFRAFHNYWSIPAGAKTAKTGKWLLGPDLDFFRKVRAQFGNARIIAEDLGDIDEGVRQLLAASGLPGMSVLHFAYSCEPANAYLPHNHIANQVLYAGTHDNDTSRGWYEKLAPASQDQLRRYLRISGQDVSWDLVRECYRSVARLAVVSAQDILSLGSEARMNTPGTSMGNWQWRMSAYQFEQLQVHQTYLHELASLYGRLKVEKPLKK